MKPNMTKGTDRHQGLRGRAGDSSKCAECSCWNAHIHGGTEYDTPFFSNFSGKGYGRMPIHISNHPSKHNCLVKKVLWKEWVNKLPSEPEKEKQISHKASRMLTMIQLSSGVEKALKVAFVVAHGRICKCLHKEKWMMSLIMYLFTYENSLCCFKVSPEIFITTDLVFPKLAQVLQ